MAPILCSPASCIGCDGSNGVFSRLLYWLPWLQYCVLPLLYWLSWLQYCVLPLLYWLSCLQYCVLITARQPMLTPYFPALLRMATHRLTETQRSIARLLTKLFRFLRWQVCADVRLFRFLRWQVCADVRLFVSEVAGLWGHQTFRVCGGKFVRT